jgi:poly(A) polymerase
MVRNELQPNGGDRGGGRRPRIVPADTISPQALDRDARRVITRLQRHGHEAYFVGGCVRDLWIGREPKDFDVATSAHPHEIRRLFRNGRIIGRRFRLVHIYYGERVVETSTFRCDPLSEPEEDLADASDAEEVGEDLLILEDNAFGTAAEDARRRDFTVNGLFLDPARHCILDYVDGLADLEARVLRTIGDPLVRMQEDPVRILRAVKFATRLDFRIDDATWQAMRQHAQKLRRSAPPRVLEEVLRLMRSGASQGAVKMLRACGALEVLLPPLGEHLGPRDDRDPDAAHRAERFWRLLEALDSQVNHSGYVPTTAVAIAVLFLHVIEREADPETRTLSGAAPDIATVCDEVLEPVIATMRLPRRDFARARRIISQQARFTQPPAKKFSPLLFTLGEEFPEALELFGLRVDARGQGRDIYQGWETRMRRAQQASREEIEEERRKTRKRRRRRGRRRRKAEHEQS